MMVLYMCVSLEATVTKFLFSDVSLCFVDLNMDATLLIMMDTISNINARLAILCGWVGGQ